MLCFNFSRQLTNPYQVDHRSEFTDLLCAGRYCILFMAIFSIYTGILYNEFFSIPLTIFGGGRWVCPSDPSISSRISIAFNHELCPDAANNGLVPGRGASVNVSNPYPIGIDPTWHGTRSELPFLNSLKMKMSVILGALIVMLAPVSFN